MTIFNFFHSCDASGSPPRPRDPPTDAPQRSRGSSRGWGIPRTDFPKSDLVRVIPWRPGDPPDGRSPKVREIPRGPRDAPDRRLFGHTCYKAAPPFYHPGDFLQEALLKALELAKGPLHKALKTLQVASKIAKIAQDSLQKFPKSSIMSPKRI